MEEILLNKKRFFTLLKRGGDYQNLVDKIFNEANITEDRLKRLEIRENKKIYSCDDEEYTSQSILSNSSLNGIESIRRIRILKEINETGDIEPLYYFLPPAQNDLDGMFKNVLEKLKLQGSIADYKTIVNTGRRKTGLPSHDNLLEEIYIYDAKGYDKFDENITLRKQIESIEKNIPWIFVYFVPKDTGDNVDKLAESILNQIADEVGKTIGDRYTELFGAGV